MFGPSITRISRVQPLSWNETRRVFLRSDAGPRRRIVPKLLNCPTRYLRTSEIKGAQTSGTEIISKKVKINGINFHVEKTGKGEHTVLFIPGALGSTRTDFGPQLENFNKDKFTLVAFDPQGYGKSIPPERTWTSDFYSRDSDDAVSIMKALGFNKFSIIGWSDGGICGLIIAARYPTLVDKLIVFGSNAFISDEDLKMAKAVEDISNWSDKMRKPFVDLYGLEYFKKHWSEWVKYYEGYHIKGTICREELPNIVCPTLIIHGAKDKMVDAVHPEHLKANITGSRLHILPEGKHNLHLRYPEEFQDITEKFLLNKAQSKL